MNLNDIRLTTLDGDPTTFGKFANKAVLVVNVASRCGFTPQYAGLESLYRRFADRGFTVLGFPCNQFMFQEPGDADDIKEFCSTTYGVTFPMFDKVKVKGTGQHPLFEILTVVEDSQGEAGNVQWNFEKFLVAPGGQIHRFRSKVAPDDAELIDAIENALPTAAS